MKGQWVKVESEDELTPSVFIRLGPVDCCSRTFEAVITGVETDGSYIDVKTDVVVPEPCTGYRLSNYCCDYLYSKGSPALTFKTAIPQGRILRYVPPPEEIARDKADFEAWKDFRRKLEPVGRWLKE